MNGSGRRPSRDTAPIAAAFVVILVGLSGVVLLDGSAYSWQPPGGGRVFVGVLFLVTVLVTVAAAVVSFLAYLEWYSGRRVKLAPSVHLGAGVAAAVSAVVVTAYGLGWTLSARGSAQVMLGLVTLVGGLSMGTVAVDVVRNRQVPGRSG